MKNIIISILLSAMLIIMSFQPCYSHADEVGSDVTQQVVLEPGRNCRYNGHTRIRWFNQFM